MSSNLSVILFVLAIFWTWLGTVHFEQSSEDRYSYAQIIIHRILSGPAIWVSSLCQLSWFVLGLIGKR